MRKKLFTLLFAVMACTNFIHADFVQNVIGPTQTITYHFYTESRTAEVVGYQLVSGEVVIPEEILWADVYYRVTGIGHYAFYDCIGLISVTIGNSVTSIGHYAFSGCSGLTSVTIGNSVTSIGEWAFWNCSSLTSVTIGNSVTSIGVQAFYECTGLTSITIPNSVTSIGDAAFADCSGLTSVTIGNGITSIGYWAFAFCKSLTSITIPNSVTSIGGAAFSGCSGLTSIVVGSGNTTYDSRNNCNAIIENSSNTLIAGCMNTIIPNSVTSIGELAFYDCTSLNSITIPNSVTSIGSAAFERCTSLTSVTIPNSVTSIGAAAFMYCSGLTSITNYATEPQVIDEDVFGGDKFEEDGIQYGPVDKTKCILYVPAQSVSLYKAADVWKEFLQILPINEAEEGIENVQRDDVQCTKVQKILHDGQILILQGEKTYTLTGAIVK